MGRILVVDDEKSMRDFFDILLRKQGHEVTTAPGGAEALSMLARNAFDLVITDLKMPQVTGLDVLKGTREFSPHTEVIVMTAYSTVDTAIQAMKLGAFNYLSKPFNNDEITLVIEKALEKRNLVAENQRLQEALEKGNTFARIVGQSAAMRDVFRQIRQVAPMKTTVLITGESGTGKELIARAIHQASGREHSPIAVVNCGAVPENLMESELFGHMKGSFTGATVDKKGMAQMADGGTLFLDEVGELNLQMQVKLLRLLQEKKVKPVGGVKEIEVSARIIAATNRDLEADVVTGAFREDLFFRLNVIHIHIPPLRERREDIPLLARYFLDKFAGELDKTVKGFERETMHMLMTYNFPGNVRELENVVERALAFETSEWVTPASLPPKLLREVEAHPTSATTDTGIDGFTQENSLDHYLERIEKHHLEAALKAVNGSVTRAAERLGLSFRSMRYKMSKFGISR